MMCYCCPTVYYVGFGFEQFMSSSLFVSEMEKIIEICDKI